MSATQQDTPVTETKRSVPTLIARLQEEATESQCFNATMMVFSMRERARQQVTIESLMARMKSEGFVFSKKDYQEVLKKLSKFGFGTLAYDASNEISALKNINITLQSIGDAVLKQGAQLKTWKPAVDFKPLTTDKPHAISKAPIKKAADVPIKAWKAPETKAEPTKYEATVMVKINGKTLNFDLPYGITPNQLTQLLAGA